MNSTHALHLSALKIIRKTFGWLLRFVVLVILYFALFAASGQIVGAYLPTNVTPEPGRSLS